MKTSFSLLFMLCAIFAFSQSKKPVAAGTAKKPASTVQVALPPLPGKYGGKQASGAIDSLILKADSTYRFATYQPGMTTPESFAGKWKVKKNDVFLYAGADPEPYGQVRAIVGKDGKLEKFKIVRYFGDLQKGAVQPEIK